MRTHKITFGKIPAALFLSALVAFGASAQNSFFKRGNPGGIPNINGSNPGIVINPGVGDNVGGSINAGGNRPGHGGGFNPGGNFNPGPRPGFGGPGPGFGPSPTFWNSPWYTGWNSSPTIVVQQSPLPQQGITKVIACGYNSQGVWKVVPLQVSYQQKGSKYIVNVLNAWNPITDKWDKDVDMPAYSCNYKLNGERYHYYVSLPAGTFYFNL